MRVYVVVGGEYDDARNIAVFAKRKTAEERAREYSRVYGTWRNGECVADGAYIQEWDVE